MQDDARIIVAGTIRVPPENVEALKQHIANYVAVCRAEDGCVTFAFSEDLQEPGLIRVFEIWRSAAALDAHKGADHVKTWRALWPQYGVHGRSLARYEIASTESF